MNAISDFPISDDAISGAMVQPHVRGLFDGDIAVALCDPRAPMGSLLSPERQGMGRMVAKRQLEFTAGRIAAHRAMAALGRPRQPVIPGPDRAPIWPDGLVGSLSHCDSLCVCVMAPTGPVRSLGVDVEEDTALDPEMIETILTPPERAWMARQPEDEAGRLAKLIFSAKETAYKAQYPMTREVLDFGAIAILPDLAQGRFTATFTRAVGPFASGSTLQGRMARAHDLILTGLTLRPQGAA
ncbi:4'-phosphopantetheinyl transferase family protein [Oceaniglobus ichthyenteri]|uniref:4'-phosphopantetheinyl transferase family protein n=1 Tax=Oceaniglobus ichthyenteri TaxID=2136177 RepID=UPI001F0C655B|nr:4'-phosphopantetheinyl transferase superfamily protein [Oceaniglobus ichthyenteri]